MARASAKHPTLRDVAALAGVSHQTVSRVINGREVVTPETRGKVEAAIQQLGFLPNAIARSMAQGRTGMLACLAPNLTDYTYASNMQGAEAVARAHGYFLLCAAFADEHQFDALIEQLIGNRRVDGVIVISPYLDDRYIRLPESTPVVLMGGCLRDDVRHLVYLDNRAAAAKATRHLLDLGHTRIAQITGPLAEDCAQERDLGYREALSQAGIRPDPMLTMGGDWNATCGFEAAMRLLQNGDPPTGIVTQNDRLAVGVIRAARDLGLRVPEQLSVIGFDDMPLASYFDPSLTTMRQDTFDVGQTCARLLVDLLDGRITGSQHVRLSAELVVRQSTDRCHFTERR